MHLAPKRPAKRGIEDEAGERVREPLHRRADQRVQLEASKERASNSALPGRALQTEDRNARGEEVLDGVAPGERVGVDRKRPFREDGDEVGVSKSRNDLERDRGRERLYATRTIKAGRTRGEEDRSERGKRGKREG